MRFKTKFYKKVMSLALILLLSIYPANNQQKVAYSQTKTLETEELLRIPEPTEIQKIPVKEYNPLSDIIAPKIDLSTLSVSQKTAVPGDTMTLRVKASDVGSGVDFVMFRVDGENGGSFSKHIYTPDEDGYYKFSITVSEKTQSGLWKPYWIVPYDKTGNYTSYFASNTDLSAGNFEVINPKADIIPPLADISTLSVSQKTAVPGDTVTLRVKASDVGSGIDFVMFRIDGENGGSFSKHIYTPDEDGYYKFSITVSENTQSGLWKPYWIVPYDKTGNYTSYFASNTDLSAANFEVVDHSIPENPINAEVVTSNTTWNYKTVDRDVYVGPEAILTINGDVKVNGNIYVLGAVVSYGALKAKDIYAHSLSYGNSSTIYQGSFNIRGGSHSIEKLVATSHPIPNIPIEIYSSNEVSADGYLAVIEGATLPIGDLYLGNESVGYNYNGTFSLSNVYVGGKSSLTFKIVDVFGKPHVYEFILNNPNAVSLEVLSGSTRYETAVKISQALYKTADTAVLVRADDFPDALSAGPLAHALNAPILLTQTGRIGTSTLDELKRLNVMKVVLLGGEGAIGTNVAQQLQAMYQVERISGRNRYMTALEAAEKLKAVKGTPQSAILTSGVNFADALSAGSYAARHNMPLLLTNGKTVTAETMNFIQTNGMKEITIMGGSAAISEEVDEQLKGLGITVNRIYGSSRYNTAAIMAQTHFSEAQYAIAASGMNYVDALAAIPYAASLEAPILLVHQTRVADSVINYLKNNPISTLYVIGGDATVSSTVRDSLLVAIE